MLTAFRHMILLIFDVCRLQKGPQDFPYSTVLLSIFAGINLTVAVIKVAIPYGFSAGLATSVATIVCFVAFTFMVLKINNKRARLVQTLTTLFAVNDFIYFVLLLGMPVLQAIITVIPSIASLLPFLLLVFSIWVLVIQGHIYRHAIGSTLLVGVLISVVLTLLTSVLFAVVLNALNITIDVGT